MFYYTYLIKFSLTNQVYYGCRSSKIEAREDLFKIYFTSSKLVKRLIKEHGVEQFSYEIRKLFSSYENARKWEYKVLHRMKVVKNPNFLNQAVSCARLPKKDERSLNARRMKISNSMKLLWKDAKYRKLHTLTRESSLLGNKTRIENYFKKNGLYKRKRRLPTDYKNISIIRNNIVKTITQNQYHPYKKLGWILNN